MKLISKEYYWIVFEGELLIGFFDDSYGFGSWTMCGTELIVGTKDIEIISHVERP